MPPFTYKAKNGPQYVTSGIIEADTITDAVAKLTKAGQIPMDVRPSVALLEGDSPRKKGTVPFNKVSQAALFQFTRQLADLLDAGIPLARCMELLSHQRQFPKMAAVIDAMTVLLKQGGSLSFALAQYPAIFSSLYVHTVKAAEASGQLPLVLNRLAQFLESDMQTQSRVKSSLLYPGIIFLVGMLTLFVLLTFVLPRITMMFEDLDVQLPLATRIVVFISSVFVKFWWLMLGVLAVVVWQAGIYVKTEQGKLWMDVLSLKTPLLKTFIENTQVSRFARTLGMLIESGVPIVTALESVTMVVDNRALRQEVRMMAIKVKSGMSLTQAMKTSPFFPEMAVDLIAVGQESGKLERGLYKLAQGADRTAQDLSGTFVTVLGPAVLVIVVGIVGFMVVAMLLPIFQMNMIIQ